ncbi:hypothetical protein [Methylobacterium sp. MA0201]|uniref:hypothetical protein n=1 Tax=Methylobacterium alsaeris TaxID=3344826 RepID=UPI003756E379
MSGNLIPAEHAEFFWNSEPGKAPHEFVVMDIRERQKQREETGRDPSQRYNSSMGAHVIDWLTGDGPHDHPEGLFATEWVDRGTDRKTIKQALHEIGKIDRCEWARLMYSALDFYDRRSEDN